MVKRNPFWAFFTPQTFPKVIVAPSGAGKTFASNQGFVQDADKLESIRAVYKYLDAKFGMKWWARGDYKSVVRPEKVARMYDAFDLELHLHRQGKPVATAELETVSALKEEELLHDANVVVLLPTPEQLTSNQRAKIAEGNTSQPHFSHEKNERMITDYARRAKHAGLRIEPWPDF